MARGGSFHGLHGARNEVFARLGHDHDGHVIGDEVLVDEAAHKVEVRLRCGRKTDLDLLEADAHELVKELHLALAVHGLEQGLVAVAQIGGQPHGRVGDAAGGPLAVGQSDRGHGLVLGGGFGNHDKGSTNGVCGVKDTVHRSNESRNE